MKEIIQVLIIVCILPCISHAQTKAYSPQVGISVVGGVQENKHIKGVKPVYGIEFSMECPLMQNTKSRIRQQFSFVRQEDKEYKSVTIEMNP